MSNCYNGYMVNNNNKSLYPTVKPIIYGNISKSFGKKREEDGHTHQWTVYVKPYRLDRVANPWRR